MAVFVDVDVAVFISGGGGGDDDDDDVDFIAVATLSEISVIIAVDITDGTRNNVDFSRMTLSANGEKMKRKKTNTAPELAVSRCGIVKLAPFQHLVQCAKHK